MSLATRHGPVFPHRKTTLPGDCYLMRLAVTLGRWQGCREDWMAKARRATDAADRAFCVARARDWHKLCRSQIDLMRQEERFQRERVAA